MKRTAIISAIITCSLYILLCAGQDYSKIEKLIFSWQTEEAESAIEKLKEPPAYLLGLKAFYDGNYPKALEYFRKKPSEYARIKEMLEELTELTDVFETIETKHFIVRYTGKDRILAVYLDEVIDEKAQKLFAFLDWYPKHKIILEIYPERSIFQIASTLTDKHIKVSGAIGICKFNRIMISSPRILKFGFSWMDTAVHESVHYVIAKKTGLSNMPLWLNEGLAKYLETSINDRNREMRPIEINFLIKGSKTGEWVSFEKMKHGMPTLDSKDEVSLAFAQVHSMTEYLVEEYGHQKLMEYLEMIKDEESDTVFEKVYGITVGEFQEQWEKYIKIEKMTITPGAKGPSYTFAEEPGNALSEWVSEIAMTDVNVADRFRKNGKYRIAKRKYKEALKKDPGNPVILNKLAKMQLKDGNRKEALGNFLQSIETNPEYPPSYLHAGKIFFELKEYEKAKYYLMDYIYRSPFNPESHRLILEIGNNLNEYGVSARESGMLKLLSDE